MAKPNTATMRVDPRFKKMIDEILETKPRTVKTPRFTLGMYRQYKKNPKLLKELMDADFK